jgi:hypothetical protein
MRRWIQVTTTAGTVLGITVVVYGLARFAFGGSIVGLLVAVAVLIVGPGEDLLQKLARQRASTPERGEAWATIVDRVTSIAFLIVLGLVIYL